MKGFRKPSGAGAALNLLFLATFISAGLLSAARAQQAPAEAVPEADAVQRRVTRARSLAAVGKLAAAAAELEPLSAATSDDSAREVARILLMSIFVEMPDYGRAGALLEEAYKGRSAKSEKSESAPRSYYALAGQTVKSVRMHVERYRTFGINVSDDDLPAEAKGDLDQLRSLLERVCEQAKAIREEDGREGARDRSADASALIEDAANARLRLARGDQERAKWAQEVSDARQRLFASETRVGKISDAPVQTASVTPVPGGINPYGPAPSAADKPKASPHEESGGAEVARATAPAQSVVAPPQTGTADAEAKKSEGGPISVGALQGKAEKRVDPSYPQLAKMARVSGSVTVYVIVDEKGGVESVQRIDGPVQLQAAAKDAVRRWKFKPTVINGQPARVSGYINFNFSL